MKKAIVLARTVVKFPKSKTNQKPIRYEYELMYFESIYIINLFHYIGKKLCYVKQIETTANKEKAIYTYIERTSQMIEII